MRVAVMQSTPVRDVEHNLQRLADALEIGARQRADLLVTPEMFLSGYNIGGSAVRAAARPIDGEHLDRIGELASRAGVAVAVGLPERDGEDVFNTAALVSSTGELLTWYRKTHLYGELDRAQFTPGDRLGQVVQLAGLRVALAICFDIEFPEVARTLSARGADAIIVPTANWLASVNTRLVPARAEENGTYVIYANHWGREGDMRYCGRSCIVDPWGEDVLRMGDGERILVGEIQASAVGRARAAIDYLGQRRPELYDG